MDMATGRCESAPPIKGCEKEEETDKDDNYVQAPTQFGVMWVKARDFIGGDPSPRDFKLERYMVASLNKGELLVEGLCWSVENYMRVFDVKLGSAMIGEQVGCVISTRHEDFPQWTLVVCPVGWRTHTIVDPRTMPVRPIVNIGEFPASVCLGNLGFPGLTAYFGFIEICQPKPGNIVLVNAAGGSVGSVVGQLAKIKGCTVIAFAGSRERCDWMRELGFDYVYCSSVTVNAALARQAPGGIDCFFDCVGAEFTKQVMQHMKPEGTICVCGYNSGYGRRVGMERRGDPYRLVHMRGGKVTSNWICDFRPQFAEAQAQMLEWMAQGKLKFHETVTSGFDKLPDALAALHADSSVGNVIVTSSKVNNLRADVAITSASKTP